MIHNHVYSHQHKLSYIHVRYARFQFDDTEDMEIVLDHAAGMRVTPLILQTHRIPEMCSRNVKSSAADCPRL